jgi:DNA repair exonuclease SbcCD ATPase subunit
VECSFEIENKKNKTYDFMIKIIKFIDLYLDKKLITNLDEYTIKPIILYNNNYCLNKTNIKNIKSDIDGIKINIENLKNKKLEEIYKNLQIIYCWPTIPICNNYTSNIINNKLEESIGKYETELNKTKNQLDETKNQLDEIKNQLDETNKELDKTKKQVEGLQRIVTSLQNKNNFKKFNDTNKYNYRYKKYNNNNYHKKFHNYYNSNYHNKYKIKCHYKYLNSVNKRNNINSNNYYYNEY